ncbi:MAG TPA: hypothetical protein PKX28_05015, partial [Candidatus Hydrogenedentes bacterium]|nr:hypothetical protein [Candidatus Hydrogenedentota bacterium]
CHLLSFGNPDTDYSRYQPFFGGSMSTNKFVPQTGLACQVLFSENAKKIFERKNWASGNTI